ncbi:MAG TPA: hypothetical protein VJ731_09260 [Terriglobales bacterium]|nr:hypothetical protein [Terriglobales bacterium]
MRFAVSLLLVLIALPLSAQQASDSHSISLPRKDIPKASLWEPYSFQIEAAGGSEPYHWRVINGFLPHNFRLSDRGELSGVLDGTGPFQFAALVRDNSNPPKQRTQQFVLAVEVPLTVDWKQKAQVNGQRIDGSVKVSNHTGRDFDLTYVVLAVNDIGRATAIGYQRFPLKRDTLDMELPFGDTLAPGNYAVNIDVVGEEPVSKRIFRARLVAPKQAITAGP